MYQTPLAQTQATGFISDAKICISAMFPCVEQGCLELFENISQISHARKHGIIL